MTETQPWAGTEQQVGPPGPAGIHFLFPHTLESPSVPSLPPKPLLLSESPWPLLFSLPTSPSGALSLALPLPSPLCHPHIPLSQAPSGLSSAQKGTLRQEQLQKLCLPPLISQPLSPHTHTNPQTHTLPLPTASITQPRHLPSSSTHLRHLLSWCPQMSRGRCCSTQGSCLLGPRAYSQILLGPCKGSGLCQVFREEQTCLTGLRPTQPGLPPLQGEAGTPGTTTEDIDPHASPLSRVGPEVTVLKNKGNSRKRAYGQGAGPGLGAAGEGYSTYPEQKSVARHGAIVRCCYPRTPETCREMVSSKSAEAI